MDETNYDLTLNELQNVRILSVQQIAERWYREGSLGLPQTTILSELKRACELFLSQRNWREDGLPDENSLTREKDFPVGSDAWELSKAELKDFCDKQGWAPPGFWFPETMDASRPRGRPSNKQVALKVFRERKATGDLHSVQIQEARWLRAWLIENGYQAVLDTTVASWISAEFRN